MKKKYLLLVLLIPLILSSCDFMCIKRLFYTYLLIDELPDSNINVSCKCEKLNIVELTKCEEISSDEMINEIKRFNLNNSEFFRVFYIPHDLIIDDYKRISILFNVDVDGELYTGELYINNLGANKSSDTEKISFDLKSDNGKSISAVFTFEFHMSL